MTKKYLFKFKYNDVNIGIIIWFKSWYESSGWEKIPVVWYLKCREETQKLYSGHFLYLSTKCQTVVKYVTRYHSGWVTGKLINISLQVWFDGSFKLFRRDHRPIVPLYPDFTTHPRTDIHDYRTGIHTLPPVLQVGYDEFMCYNIIRVRIYIWNYITMIVIGIHLYFSYLMPI